MSGHPQIWPADVVLFDGTSRFAHLIRAFSKPAEKVRATHAALGVDHGIVVEAVTRGVVQRAFPLQADTLNVRVYRPLTLSANDRDAIAAIGRSYVGRPYGWGKVALHAVGLQRFSFMDQYPVCSWVVAASYAKACGLWFGVPVRTATPDDIDDYVRERTDRYERIW